MQVLADGLVAGASIALLAVAFAVAYVPTRAFHIALGGVYMFVPYLTWQLLHQGLPAALAVAAAVATGVALSLGCEAFNHRLLERRRAPPEVHLISSLGIYIVISQAVMLAWGADSRFLRPGLDSSVTWQGITLSRSQLILIALAITALGGFAVWLRMTRTGLRFRALADNADELALIGYNVQRLRLAAFGISGALASAAAIAVAFDVGFGPRAGLNSLLLAVVATVIAGRNSLLAPILGGFLLGVLRTEVAWLGAASWQDGVVFALLAAFLALRPHGLLGVRQRLESEP